VCIKRGVPAISMNCFGIELPILFPIPPAVMIIENGCMYKLFVPKTKKGYLSVTNNLKYDC